MATNLQPGAQGSVQVCPQAKSGVTQACSNCGAQFEPVTSRQRFCGDACRQAAHRKSPAHRAFLDKQIKRRAKRRLDHYRERNRSRSLGPHGYSGPVYAAVGRLGSLELPQI